jgi:hypothetical protein
VVENDAIKMWTRLRTDSFHQEHSGAAVVEDEEFLRI